MFSIFFFNLKRVLQTYNIVTSIHFMRKSNDLRLLHIKRVDTNLVLYQSNLFELSLAFVMSK